ncbi:MAG: xanthine dehydrogenase small subunit [Alphaproteobacteria bacterium]
MSRASISFLRRGKRIDVENIDPRMTLLEWLRLSERSTGTKEGCAEGDCGACTVVLARERNGRLVYEPVNACILLLGQADGTDVITVEDLETSQGLHPVQTAMVQRHGSQCGYCTPGIVMSLFALSHARHEALDRDVINDALAGNLCRCTGYKPIVEAALESCAAAAPDQFDGREGATLAELSNFRAGEDVFMGNDEAFFAAPGSEASLAFLLKSHPDATLVAGATDVGLWITKGLQDLKKIIWLGRIRSLATIEESETSLTIGASITHQQALPRLAALDPDIGELARRFGSTQVRMSGTVVGNIANGSPIGDWPPVFIALGATLELREGFSSRKLPLEDFFIAYRKQNREPQEYLRRVTIQKPGPDDHIRVFKVTKRRDEDISAVMGAFKITVKDGIVADARIAFGGMAGIPKRAFNTERAIIGASIKDIATWRSGAEAMERDFEPLSDHRASAEYRMRVARNLVIKAMAEIAGVPSSTTRIFAHRESTHAAE